MPLLAQAVCWFVAVNLAAFLAFRHDKRQAERRGWRISENTLLGLALVGGTVGAIAAQRCFRHKTTKEPFRSTLYGIAVLQAAAIGLWFARPDLFEPVRLAVSS